jgi:DNA-binding transcriptional LysR family regulator
MDSAELTGLDLNLLVVLDVLLAERNVTRAASRLGLSQPAVSNALSRLRTAFADPLLVRTPHGMAPTPRAIGLEAPLREALSHVRGAVAGASEFEPATARRTFVLAATDYVQFVLLGPLVRRVHELAPGVTLRVLPMTHGSPWQELEAGAVDLTLSGTAARQSRLHRRALFRDRVVCIVRADHPAAGRTLSLARYLELDHVEVLPTGGRGLADEVLDALGETRRVAITVPHFLVAPFVILDNDYCFTLAERIARPMADYLSVRVMPLPMEFPTITVWAYWHERLHHDAAHQWLRRLVAEVAAQLDDERVARPRLARRRGAQKVAR